jgi:hypothetical protein
VHPSAVHHLALCGIPEFVVGLGVFELAFVVENGSRIFDVIEQSSPCPRLGDLERVIQRIMQAHIDGEFAPDDEFIEERLSVFLGRVGVLRGKHDR